VDGLLTELSSTGFRHRISMYADDVVVRTTRMDLMACASIVEDFSVASGLSHQPGEVLPPPNLMLTGASGVGALDSRLRGGLLPFQVPCIAHGSTKGDGGSAA
jgi:hypothetical protein